MLLPWERKLTGRYEQLLSPCTEKRFNGHLVLDNVKYRKEVVETQAKRRLSFGTSSSWLYRFIKVPPR